MKRAHRSALCRLGPILSFLLAAACSSGGSGGPPGALTYRVDPSVVAVAPSIPNKAGAPRALGAVRDAAGTTSSFVLDEVIVTPRDRAELDAFVAKYQGTIVGNDAVPVPPADLGVAPSASDLAPTQYLVRVDTSSIDTSTLAADAQRASLSGDVTVSSESALKLLALVTREKAGAMRVSPNFVGESAGLLSSTREQPDGKGGFRDGFATVAYQTTGSKSNVVRAWQYVAQKSPPRRARVAIIDGGFWLDAQGQPQSALASGLSDLPSKPWQYDFLDDDYVADGVSPSNCTGGATCHWHGNEAASTAIGRLDNEYGAAGVAGQAADPLLFKTTLDASSLSRAIRTAVKWGADVVSMSFGIQCDNVFCDGFFETNLYPAMRNARDNGVVMVAAAGNGHDVGGGVFMGEEANVVPCRSDNVICVGAISAGTNTSTSYSNYGKHVDIWAPTNIDVMPDGDNHDVHNYGGTSASTPFVAGIAALMKAYNRNLNSDDVNAILWETAWKDSPDWKVTGSVNAFAALSNVAGDSPPAVVITSPTGGAKIDAGGLGLLLHANVIDLEEGSPCCSVAWSSNVDGDLGTGAPPYFETAFAFQTLGPRTITATATDKNGLFSSASITIDVVAPTPSATILSPSWNQSVTRGVTQALAAVSSDSSAGTLSCTWTSDNAADTQFPLQGCSQATSFATSGSRTLTLVTKGALGGTASANVAIQVVDPPLAGPPIVSIVSPSANGSTVVGSGTLALEAYAKDPDGGPSLTYRWTWTSSTVGCSEVDLSVAAWSMIPVNANFTYGGDWDTNAALNVPNGCGYGAGTLKLYVTDSQNQTGSTAIPYQLTYLPPPR